MKMDPVRIDQAPNGHFYAHVTVRDDHGFIVTKFIDDVDAVVRAALRAEGRRDALRAYVGEGSITLD